MGEAMSRRGIAYRYIRLFDGEPVPKDIERYTGLIILGGPMNVYEEERFPFLKDEDRVIKRAMDRGIPILGICLGAQLIAKANNARVEKGDKKEIGWYELKLSRWGKEDVVFGGFPERLTVFQWHGDTFGIPDGATHLAGSELFSNQAYRIGDNIYGLQFHLEVTEGMIRQWMVEYQDELASLDYIDPEKIISDTNRYIHDLSRHAEGFYDRLWSSVLR